MECITLGYILSILICFSFHQLDNYLKKKSVKSIDYKKIVKECSITTILTINDIKPIKPKFIDSEEYSISYWLKYYNNLKNKIMKKEYKLIKEYPGCLYKKDDIVYFNGTNYRKKEDITCYFVIPNEVENYSEYWEEIKAKEFEITALASKDYKYIYSSNVYKLNEFSIENNNIYSVKRLSDGVEFKVGDIINRGIINSFFIDNSFDIVVICKDFLDYKEVNSIQVIQHIKQPLFKTEDNINIYEGDKYYCTYDSNYREKQWIYEIFEASSIDKSTKLDLLDRSIHRFSTKEKAEEYIIMNKPCLSLKEVQDTITNVMVTRNGICEYFKELIIKKLKNEKD